MDQSLAKIDADWLKKNASMGREDIAMDDLPLPYLSLTQTTSSKTFLEDGTVAPAGLFYYAATKKATPEFPCVFVKVEKTQEPKYNAPDIMEDVFTFVGATEGDWKPFIFKCRGMTYTSAGKFIRDLKIQNEAPMFAYRIVLKARGIETKNGLKYIATFTYALRTDSTELFTLKTLAEKMVGKPVSGFAVEEEEEVSEPTEPGTENVPPSEIPF